MRPTHLTAALAAAALCVGALATAVPAQAVDTTRIQPDRLERGADPSVPYVLDGTYHDGDVSVRLRRGARLLGPSGEDHLLAVPVRKDDAGRSNVVRVRADGTRSVLLRKVRHDAMVASRDGSRLFVTTFIPGRGEQMRTRLRVWRLGSSAKRITRRVVPGFGTPLVATRARVWISDWERGTYTLNTRGNKRTRVSRLVASAVHLDQKLLAGYTGDPYLKGCTRVVRLGTPRKALWKSCDERVEAFNPAGNAFATVHILSDGIGPNEVTTRRLRGKATGRYATRWFGQIGWETNRDLLVEANGRRSAALVRCRAGACENASDPRPVSSPRG
jgi:hypothetical protein